MQMVKSRRQLVLCWLVLHCSRSRDFNKVTNVTRKHESKHCLLHITTYYDERRIRERRSSVISEMKFKKTENELKKNFKLEIYRELPKRRSETMLCCLSTWISSNREICVQPVREYCSNDVLELFSKKMKQAWLYRMVCCHDS